MAHVCSCIILKHLLAGWLRRCCRCCRCCRCYTSIAAGKRSLVWISFDNVCKSIRKMHAHRRDGLYFGTNCRDLSSQDWTAPIQLRFVCASVLLAGADALRRWPEARFRGRALPPAEVKVQRRKSAVDSNSPGSQRDASWPFPSQGH